MCVRETYIQAQYAMKYTGNVTAFNKLTVKSTCIAHYLQLRQYYFQTSNNINTKKLFYKWNEWAKLRESLTEQLFFFRPIRFKNSGYFTLIYNPSNIYECAKVVSRM